eukprot:TRINITY_DN1882_c0_g1_i1.p1 TRINITY_DN1882_c0_g1~~TRINITY_DN1882_c0_g1_i1.p1  ORF type:complete len:872 (-),score=247.67 TRINITY_DN1882_c0_g1_i1:13-2559(-)
MQVVSTATARLTEHDDDNLAQTEATRDKTSIWGSLFANDKEAIQKLLAADPRAFHVKGAVGENPIHMAFLFGHLELAMWMMQQDPTIISQIYSGADYQGENLLHIAIVKQYEELVRYLVRVDKRLMSGRATGKFFSHGKTCYYGEYPLSFAACTDQEHIVTYLVSQGADLTAADSNGNTVFHMLVIHENPHMYDVCEEIWNKLKKRKLIAADSDPMLLRNADNLTPFTLAAHLGQERMFSHLIEKRHKLQWAYGPVSAKLLLLDEFDCSLYKNDPPGALDIIVDKEHLNLLMHPRVIDLLTKKWNRFGKKIFYFRFLFVMTILGIFLLSSILNTGDPNHFDKPVDQFRTFLECIVLAVCLYKFQRELAQMIESGPAKHFGVSGAAFVENLVGFCFPFLLLLVLALRIADSPLSLPVLSVASVFGWMYMCFFLLGWKLTGPFVVMIGKMVTTDVVRFFLIYISFLLGFTQAFLLLFNEYDGTGGMFNIFGKRLSESFFMLLGQVNIDDYASTEWPVVSIGLLIIYIAINIILLLNLLIAMMGDTFSRIFEEAEKQWTLEWARIIFSIESEMPEKERRLKKNMYWTELEDGDADGTDKHTKHKKRFLQIEETDSTYWDKEKAKRLEKKKQSILDGSDLPAASEAGKRALIIIDVQNDFCPTGSLPVPRGDEVVGVINALRTRVAFDYVVRTQDWHPADHVSFAINNKDKKPFDVLELPDGTTQVMWPAHCVQGSKGAEFHPDLIQLETDLVVQKGTDKEVDSYSGFWDNGNKKQTDLERVLRERDVSTVYIGGLATDYCVSFSALDAVTAGFKTYFIEDASRGIAPDTIAKMTAKMASAGVVTVQSTQIF